MKKDMSIETKPHSPKKERVEELEPNESDLLTGLDIPPMVIPPSPSTAKSHQMIQLIQAIDRKIPLDDYAEQNQLDFDEVLDTLEHLIARGTKLDISYFTDEVLGMECLDELFDYFDEVDGDVEKTIDEFDGIYQPEEIRLAHLVWNK